MDFFSLFRRSRPAGPALPSAAPSSSTSQDTAASATATAAAAADSTPAPPTAAAPATSQEAFDILLKVFPAEICVQILDQPGLWDRYTALRTENLSVTESSACTPYVVVPMPSPHRLRRIVFTTTSHDQGFLSPPVCEPPQHLLTWVRKTGWSSNDRRDIGTYRGSWTFFEAGLCTADQTPKPAPKCLIGRNIHASSQAREHVIVWDHLADASAGDGGDDDGGTSGDDDGGTSGDDDAFNRASTSEIRELLRHVEPGDHIVVYPMARYPGWVNYVLSVEVSVYYFAL